MGFCAQCGRPVDPALAFCPSCGAPRSPSAAPPPPAAPAPAMPAYGAPPAAAGSGGWPGGGAPRPPGPAGRVQSPGSVLLLLLVTLGIYGLFYWWRVSKETDAYLGQPNHAHGKVKLGVILLAVALPLLVVGYAMVLAAVADSLEDPSAEPAGGGAAFVVFLLAIVPAVAGGILLLIGQYRVWQQIEGDQRRRGVPSPLSPGLQLFFVLMPYVNLITTWIAYWKTQKALNDMWAPAPEPAWSPPPAAGPR